MMNNSAFTMIELIFVIVILGIISAIAIPKLSATRDDAENVRIVTNVKNATNEIASYVTAMGRVESNLSLMSNGLSQLESVGKAVMTNRKATIKVGNVLNCIVLSIVGAQDENISLTLNNSGSDHLCIGVQSMIDVSNYNIKIRGKNVRF